MAKERAVGVKSLEGGGGEERSDEDGRRKPEGSREKGEWEGQCE